MIKHMALEKLQAYSFSLPSADNVRFKLQQVLDLVLALNQVTTLFCVLMKLFGPTM